MKILVSQAALRELLQAVTGPQHILAELVMLAGSSVEQLTGEKGPITTLVEEHNHAVKFARTEQVWQLTDPMDGERTISLTEPSPSQADRYLVKPAILVTEKGP